MYAGKNLLVQNLAEQLEVCVKCVRLLPDLQIHRHC